jgi:hypothetical protein
MMRTHLMLAASLWVVLSGTGLAQAQQPAPAAPAPAAAPRTPAGTETPAVQTGPREDLRDDSGTTIVGERESPIGLYITPWRNAYSEQDIDRPARLLQVDMVPIDRDVFARQVEYYDALTAAARTKSAPPTATPAASKP